MHRIFYGASTGVAGNTQRTVVENGPVYDNEASESRGEYIFGKRRVGRPHNAKDKEGEGVYEALNFGQRGVWGKRENTMASWTRRGNKAAISGG